MRNQQTFTITLSERAFDALVQCVSDSIDYRSSDVYTSDSYERAACRRALIMDEFLMDARDKATSKA